jgi:hypothetical protein
MFIDPATNLYHMFYQDHLAEPGSSCPRVWGHLVSHDLVRHLVVAPRYFCHHLISAVLLGKMGKAAGGNLE